MVKRSVKRILASILTTTMLFSNIAGASEVKSNINVGDLTLNDVIDQLRNLSEDEIPVNEELEAAKEEYANKQMRLSKDINTQTQELVNIIVEFNTEVVSNNKAQNLSKITNDHEEFRRFLDSNKELYSSNEKSPEIKLEYTKAFNGMSLSIPGNQVENLLKSPVVKRVWNDYVITVDNPKIDEEFAQGNDREESSISNIQIDNKVEPMMNNTIPYLGVDELHKDGIDGKGIKVGVLDTGIDYNHPDFGGEKIKGYDFIDMDDDPMETTYEDWKKSGKPEIGSNGSSYYTSHGTHVSGTIAADGTSGNAMAVKGIAPNVDLSVYRVLGPYGSGYTSAILAAIDRAIEDGMDVINLSLGANINDPMYPTSIAINNAALKGVVPVVAAGNAGQGATGNTIMGSLGSPGTSPLAITVGASSVDMQLAKYDITMGETKVDGRLLARDYSNALNEFEGRSLEVVYGGLGNVADLGDLKGKAVLIERGTLTFNDKIVNASKAGAEVILIYNNVDGEIENYIGEIANTAPSFGLTKEEGQKLKALIDNNSGAKVTFGNKGTFTLAGNKLAGFSSRGPVANSLEIKPDVVAPGVAIMSTYPEFISDHSSETENWEIAYSRISGTSMATPHIAGIAALILQENPDYSVEDVKAALMNTAVDLDGNYSVYEVGAGRVNPKGAVYADTLMKVKETVKNSMDPMDTANVYELDHNTGSMKFDVVYEGSETTEGKELTIENNSDTNKTYKVSYKFQSGSVGGNLIGVVDGNKNGASIKMPETITVNAKSDVINNVSISIPVGAEQGIYEGYITLENTANPKEKINIPFAARYSQKGVEFELYKKAYTKQPSLESFIIPIFKINSPMEYVDFILLDGETNKPVGFMHRADGDAFPVGVQKMMYLSTGAYYPLTGDSENPIDTTRVAMMEEKHYKIAMVGVDADGKAYVVNDDLIVSNELPKYEISHSSGVYEVDEDDFTTEIIDGKEQRAFWIKGKLHDPVIDQLNALGYNFNQGENKLTLLMNMFPWMDMNVDEDGTFKIGIEMSDIEEMPLSTGTLIVGYSGINVIKDNQIVVVKKGQEYFTTVNDKAEVERNEAYTISIVGHNLKSAKEIEIQIPPYSTLLTVDKMEVSKEAQDYAASKGYTIESSVTGTTVKMKFLNENNEVVAIDVDELKLVDATVRNEKGLPEKGIVTKIFVNKEDGTRGFYKAFYENITNLKLDKFDFKVNASGGVLAGLSIAEQEKFHKNIEMTLVTEHETIKGIYDSNSRAHIFKDIKPTEKGRIIVNTPGYLKIDQEVTLLPKDENGNLIVNMVAGRVMMTPGDVNLDGIIDMRDFMQVNSKLGQKGENLVEDMNKNGVVDDMDKFFVYASYLSSIDNNIEAVTEIEGKTINDYLTEWEEIGLFFAPITEKLTFKAGETIKFKIGSMFQQGQAQYTLVQAQYDSKGRLLTGGISKQPISDNIAYKNYSIKAVEGATKVKVMLWSGMEYMDVLEKCIEFNIEQ